LFSYELGRSFEQIPSAGVDEFQLPGLAVGLYDVVVAFDHRREAAWIISQGLPEIDVQARQDRASDRLAWFRSLLARREVQAKSDGGKAGRLLQTSAMAPQNAVSDYLEIVSNFSADTYRRAVRRVIEYVRAGDVFQVNLSQRLLHPARTSAVELYLRLRQCSPAPFAAYFDGGDWQICSASPERFLRIERGHVETRPIKGTRPRADDPRADEVAARELVASAKDRAENVMIADLLRNDLSRTCRPDSVRVSQLCGLESYASVHHLVSVVEGRLRGDYGPLDLLRTCLPGGSVTGAPKIRAMEIISELEPTVRGAYCGALAYIGVDGRMDASILIRTITASRGWWQLPVGGGIVAQSDPADEYAETWHKAAGMLRAIAG
jgi:para-aminobenzoate synthetase component 1